MSKAVEKSQYARSKRSRLKRPKSSRTRSKSRRSHRSRSSGRRSRSKRSRRKRSRSRSKRRRHKHRSLEKIPKRTRKSRSLKRKGSERSPENRSPGKSQEGSIIKAKSRSKTRSESRHSRESRGRRSRKSRGRTRHSRSRSRSSERIVGTRPKKRRGRRSKSRRRKRSKATRSKESASIRRSELGTPSAKMKQKGRRRYLHTTRRKSQRRRGRGTSSRSRSSRSSRRRRHRKRSSRSLGERRRRKRSSRSPIRLRKKRADYVTEDYAGQMSTTFWCLLMLLCIGSMLIIVSCAITIYVIVIRPEPTRASDRKPLTKITLTHPTTTPEHRTTPEEDTQQPPTVVPTSKPAEAYYCSTDYCKREASYVKGLLSRESRPCDDFYRHVCDVWMSEHPADRRTRSLVSQDTLLQDALTHQLLDVVRSADEQDIKVAADLNDACTDTTHTALASKEAIDALFSQWKIEKWPRTDEVKDETVWTFAAELSRDLDVATIVQPSVGIDPENLVAIVIELAKPRCLCTDTNEESKNAPEVFREAVREAGTLLGASFTDEFEDRLLAACTSIAAVCHATYEDDRVVVVRFRQLTVELRVFLTVLTGGRIQEVDNVVLRSAPDFPRKLGDALQAVPPLDALNYFGFLALVRMAPFLPGDLHSLRDLFAEKLLGHTVGNSEDNTLLCARLVESVLPGCFAKAAQIWRHSTGQELPTRDWLSQLETVFLGHLLDFPWISELSSLFIRYRVKRIAFTQLGPSASYKQEACAPPNAPRADSAVQFFADISRNQQARKLQMLHSDGTLLSQEAAGSEFSTQASLRRPLQVIHVPAALFNVSVPINSSSFVFHLARVAVRLYRALVQFLHEDPYERDISMSFTEESRRRLSVLLSCFDEDAKYTLAAMAASPTSEAVASVRRDFLDRTSALILATKAFEELLPIRRIWKLDLRLAGLEELSAMQLFFIYFALDNCESADPSLHRTSMFPQYKVNVPLRHIQEFAKAFGCSAQDQMVSEVYGCYTMVHRGRQRRISTPTQDQQARGQYFSSTTPVHQGN
ncbi:uncharacterized protein LOC144110910 [Amblyomma americanum]